MPSEKERGITLEDRAYIAGEWAYDSALPLIVALVALMALAVYAI